MAAVKSFSYKGFRIVCTVMPAPGETVRGMAEVLHIADGIQRDQQIRQMGSLIYENEKEALDTVAALAKEWVDGR